MNGLLSTLTPYCRLLGQGRGASSRNQPSLDGEEEDDEDEDDEEEDDFDPGEACGSDS